jgi:hypothetical protein
MSRSPIRADSLPLHVAHLGHEEHGGREERDEDGPCGQDGWGAERGGQRPRDRRADGGQGELPSAS